MYEGSATPPLLDRDEPLAAAGALIARTEEGGGGCVIVAGEAGIGKTAFVTHVLRSHADRCTTLMAACEALHTPRPLGPFVDLADAFGPDLADDLYGSGVSRSLHPALLNHLRDAAKPTLLVIEDLQWADGATLDLFRYLARRIADVPAVLIGTYRPEDLL